jgi:glutamate racemase
VARKPGHQGERAISRKTIAQGMPDCFGEPVVTNSCAFSIRTRGCGCIERPAFPAPSVLSGTLFFNTRAQCAPRSRTCVVHASKCQSGIVLVAFDSPGSGRPGNLGHYSVPTRATVVAQALDRGPSSSAGTKMDENNRLITPDQLNSTTVASPPTILVFDSGLGGLTVLREIVAARPEAHYVYVADDAFFPYGHHSEEQIVARVVPLIGELITAQSPDLVVIACNTASTLVMSHLRDEYKVPFVGTVPAIKPACAKSKTKRVSVLGTKGTVEREYTRALIRDFAQGCEVTLVGSPELASLAEAALSGVEVNDQDISAELAPCFVSDGADNRRTDTIVLACTHYPLLLDRLVRLAPWPVDWIDPAPAIARRVANLLGPPGAAIDRAGAEMIFTSRRPHTLSQALMPFFGGRVPA